MAYVIELLRGYGSNCRWVNAADEMREPIARTFRTRDRAYAAASNAGLEVRHENDVWRLRDLDPGPDSLPRA